MSGWKAATAFFAATTLVLLVREATRTPEPREPVAPGPVASPVPPPPADAPASAVAPEAPAIGPASADAPESGSAEPPADYVAHDDPRELLIRLLFFPEEEDRKLTWPQRLALLRPRRAELAPILEEWIRRDGEIRKLGQNTDKVMAAYVALLGRDAIPLVEELVEKREGPWGIAGRYMWGSEDPEVIAAMERIQSRFTDGRIWANPYMLMRGSDAAKALVRRWAEGPPGTHPSLVRQSRDALFRMGEPEERERIYGGADDAGRRHLCDMVRASWPEPWPGRAKAAIREGLESVDPDARDWAISRVAANACEPGEAVELRTLAIIERDLAGNELSKSRRKRLAAARKRIESRVRIRETGRKLRDLLTR